jgi:large subunit ribosomal protein L10e
LAYTRKEYIGGTPQSKIRIFESGDLNLKYNYEVLLLAKNNCEIKSEALESIRLHINRNLTWKLTKSKFHFKLPIYPHQIVRRHGWLGFAGADRISKGMKLAFGKPKHRVAVVNNGQVIVNVKVISREDAEIVRGILKGAIKKIPAKGEIVIKEMV